MLFNSFEFLAFFLVFCALFFGMPGRWRPAVLLGSSYVFYLGWKPVFLALLLLTTLVDYFCALGIEAARRPFWRRAALALSLTVNLALLRTFKYLDFVLANVSGIASWLTGSPTAVGPLNLILPVGISFYTFQSIGYTLDVYNRRMPAERSLVYYAIYVSFFPQLVAGPIERAPHMIAQYKAIAPTSPQRIGSGLWLIGWGLFKKMCIADLVAPFVNGIYAEPSAYNGSYTLLATLLFAAQIYCDFSGYSDIAIGCARIIGIDLMTNFRQPYFSTSLTEFWRRWHISLSTWFRDYVYQPLGGNRVAPAKSIRNTLVVFAVSGAWHGANWTYIVWGLLHGTALVLERLLGLAPAKDAAGTRGSGLNLVRVMATSGIVIVAWVFFRARTVSDAYAVLASWAHPGALDYGVFKSLGLPSVEILIAFTHLVALTLIDSTLVLRPAGVLAFWNRSAVSMAAAVLLFYDIFLFGVFGRVDFIYFQF